MRSRLTIRSFSLVVVLIVMMGTGCFVHAQVVQFTHDPERPYVPAEIRIQSSGTIDTTTLVVWGSTVRDADSSVRNVLVYQMVKGTTPVDSARVMTESFERPYGLVRVIAMRDRFLVLWNDKRPTQSGLYRRVINKSGILLDSESRRIDTIAVSSVELYGSLSSGNAAIGWNDAGKTLSRLRRIDTAGELSGPMIRFQSTIVGSWPMPGVLSGSVVQMKDGSGIIAGSDRRPSERIIASGVLLDQLVIEPDSTVWLLAGMSARHIRRLWDISELERYSFNPLSGSTGSLGNHYFLSKVGADTFAVHYLTYRDSMVADFTDEIMYGDVVRLHSILFTARGEWIRHDSIDDVNGTWWDYLKGSNPVTVRKRYVGASLQGSCRGTRAAEYVWEYVSKQDDRAYADTFRQPITYYVDLLTGRVTKKARESCTFTVAENVMRETEESIRLHFPRTSISLRHSAAKQVSPAAVRMVAVQSRGDSITLAYDQVTVAAIPYALSAYAVTAPSTGEIEWRSTQSVGALYKFGEPHLKVHRYEKLEKYSAVWSFGHDILAGIWQRREDSWDRYYTWDYPSYTSTKIDLFSSGSSGLRALPFPSDDLLIYSHQYGPLRKLVDVAWNPNTDQIMVVVNQDYKKWDVIAIDARDSVTWTIHPLLPDLQFIIPGNGDTALYAVGDSLFAYRGEALLRSMPLVDYHSRARYHRLFGDRFLRYGIFDSAHLSLQIFDLEGGLHVDTAIDGFKHTDSLFVLVGMGDSAITLLRGNASGIEARFFSQDLVPAGDRVLITAKPIAGHLCATIARDTCYIFWIGPSNGATDVFGSAIAMPPIPDLFNALGATDSPNVEEPPIVEENPPPGAQALISLITPYTDIVILTPIPNPAQESIELRIRLTQPWPVTITLADESGRIVLRREALPSVAGENSFMLDVGELMPGAYTVVLEAGMGRGEGKMVIAR